MIFVVLGFSIIAMLSLLLYQWWSEKRSHYAQYAAFGIEIPTKYSVHGIDVSRYQEYINWDTVRAVNVDNVQINFAYVKATEGLEDKDEFFDRNWKRMKGAGLTRGAYHFFLATKSGKDQAWNFIHTVKLESGDLPPVLDIEQAYGVRGDRLRERAREWLETAQAYYGITPIIYTNIDFYNNYLKDDFDKYPLWVVHYLEPIQPRISRDWTFWQHSETGRVHGIYTRVDFNVFNGDSVEFRNILMN